jgi:hypothetical protein
MASRPATRAALRLGDCLSSALGFVGALDSDARLLDLSHD